MALTAQWIRYRLHFKQPAGTSRGIYRHRDTWLIQISDGTRRGIGECAPLPNLSCDATVQFEPMLEHACANINHHRQMFSDELLPYPAIRFGIETALLDLAHNERGLLLPSAFTRGQQGIVTNGLIWMGSAEQMQQQIATKLEQGFRCIKLKIGAIAIEREMELLAQIRERYDTTQVELRVDANGAFPPQQAEALLKQLAALNIHSIEQPIAPGQRQAMAELCHQAPIQIALDEELIGIHSKADMARLLDEVKPQAIVLKPSLHGGIGGCEQWIRLAEQRGISWWLTSALESNIGLNAIAQWCFSQKVSLPQGLGTGGLFTNNLPSPLQMQGQQLVYRPAQDWDLSAITPLFSDS